MRARSGNPQGNGARPSLARLVACKSIAPQFVRRNAHGGMHGAKAHSYQAPASRACRSSTSISPAIQRLFRYSPTSSPSSNGSSPLSRFYRFFSSLLFSSKISRQSSPSAQSRCVWLNSLLNLLTVPFRCSFARFLARHHRALGIRRAQILASQKRPFVF